MQFTAKFQKTFSSPAGVLPVVRGRARRGRPAPLPKIADPQALVLQRTMEPIVETFVPVPILDVPVPQMVGQLVDVLNIFDTMLPVAAEQVVDVPKIILQD